MKGLKDTYPKTLDSAYAFSDDVIVTRSWIGYSNATLFLQEEYVRLQDNLDEDTKENREIKDGVSLSNKGIIDQVVGTVTSLISS